MSNKEPKIDHHYDADKDKLKITIHRYSLKSKKTRESILEKVFAAVDASPIVLSPRPRRNQKRDAAKSSPVCRKKRN
jgi:hypothetical protein